MGRKQGKLKVEFIENQKNRMLTFKRRKEGVMKKAKELNALCDVKVCVILFDPHHDAPSAPVSVWPPNNPALVGGLFNELWAKGSKNDAAQFGAFMQEKAQLGELTDDGEQQDHQFLDNSSTAHEQQQDQFGETAQLARARIMDDDDAEHHQFGTIDLENSGPLMMDEELFMFDDQFDPVSDLLDYYHEEAASSSSSPNYFEPQQQYHVVDSSTAMMMDCSSGMAGFEPEGASYDHDDDDFIAQLYTPPRPTWP